MSSCYIVLFLFFFNDTATTEIYTLSLHDALPISQSSDRRSGERQDAEDRHGVARAPLRARVLRQADRAYQAGRRARRAGRQGGRHGADRDRKSTRLNSSHGYISYAVFCLKKKKK